MSYTDSLPTVGTLPLQGVWIMDPGVSPEESIRQYLYGSAQREVSVDALGEASYFAGRTDPVMEYGEHEAYSFAATVDVPFGPDWQSQVDELMAWGVAKRVLFIRDNRGRALYCHLDGMRVRDTQWGSQASFQVVRADRARTVVPA